jgi:hypothetical protein
MGLFGKSRFLEAEVELWVVGTWGWLMRNLGGKARLAATPLVLPTRDFFPPTETQGHERAVYVFERTKAWMGLADWPCTLTPYDRPSGVQRMGHFAMIQHGKSAHGTFQAVEGGAVVSYASDLVDQPRALIAVFAHELAHYLLADLRYWIPGGDDLHELVTDLTVAYLGFGVFAANAAFQFGQHQDAFGQGWRSQHSGYLSERTWAFAIALFCALKVAPLPTEHLKPGVAGLTKTAARYLKREEGVLSSLTAIA